MARQADFFDRLYPHFYVPWQTPETTGREVTFICAQLGLPPQGRILDLCCGQGRHSLELARRGYQVTGLDRSEPALARARGAAEAEGLAVRWVHGDMRDLPFTGELDGCISWFSAFGLLEDDREDQKVLLAVGQVLRPGGRFLIDALNHAWLMRNFQPRGWIAAPAGGTLHEERTFDLLTGRNVVKATATFPGGERMVVTHALRVYTLAELVKMLSAAGLHVRETWGGVDGSACTLSSRRLLVLAERG
ncbi:MAG: methyltransferase domain-containing protein [Gemmataceae bacterium]|nr:methyltransferase domain-containing protein [Gemmataceae bacterium]